MPYTDFCHMPYRILSHRGAATVQELINNGALQTWQEANGLEMVSEFTRSVGGKTMQRNTIRVERERFFFIYTEHLLWA
jgi:hypothetical protein